jgi:small subunit ribosomal protein S16
MPVRIRLKRVGAKGQPHYRIVIADGRAPRDGREIEVIGHYRPLPAQAEVAVDEERALLWLERGALPSEVVKSLLAKQGVLERFYEKWPKRRPKPAAQPAAKTQEAEPETKSEAEPQEAQAPSEATESA